MITVITPTRDRPIGMELLEGYMRSQTVQPHQWIVGDGGEKKAKLTMGQQHVHDPSPRGAGNFCRNILNALELVEGDLVFFMEDDDAYLPNHIEMGVQGLKKHAAVGCPGLKYYSILHKSYHVRDNCLPALSHTGFHVRYVEMFQRIAKQMLQEGRPDIDWMFWKEMKYQGANQPRTSYGIKGLPGNAGFGSGHHEGDLPGWEKDDAEFTQLKTWLGDLAEPYINLMLDPKSGR